MLCSGRGFALVLALFVLPACQQQQADAPQANPDAKPGMSVEGATLVLPAVRGNPGAAYFILSNGDVQAAELAAVHIDGAARTEMHETTPEGMTMVEKARVKAGGSVAFARGGMHVMAFDLADGLVAGGKTEMTLVFGDGDKLSTAMAIESAGSMEGMAASGHDGHGGSN